MHLIVLLKAFLVIRQPVTGFSQIICDGCKISKCFFYKSYYKLKGPKIKKPSFWVYKQNCDWFINPKLRLYFWIESPQNCILLQKSNAKRCYRVSKHNPCLNLLIFSTLKFFKCVIFVAFFYVKDFLNFQGFSF